MNLFVLTLLSFLCGGSGNDLLDYVPTDVYWKAKRVVVSVDAMALELKPVTDAAVAGWIADLDSADPLTRDAAYRELLHAGPAVLPKLKAVADSPQPETSRRASILIERINAAPRRHVVRRLMALRTLGELKKPEALPVLRGFLDSREMFVADYARASIAQIEGKPVGRSRAAGTGNDVWLLPAECRAVAHVELRSGRPIDYAEAFKQMPLSAGQDKDVTIDFIANQALTTAEAIGNVRLDALTVGASGDAPEKSGFVVVIASGAYDAAALGALAKKLKIVFKTVDGKDVFQPDTDTAAFLPSDDRLVLVAGGGEQDAPLAQMFAAMKSGKGKLATTPEMVKLIAAVDTSQPVWAAMQVTDAYRKAGVPEAFEEATLVGERQGAGMRFRLRGNGNDAAKVKAASDQAFAAVAQSAKEIRRVMNVVPALRVMADLPDQVKITTNGVSAKLTAELRESPVDSFLLPLMMTYGTPQKNNGALPQE
jgi:hypothetical protein